MAGQIKIDTEQVAQIANNLEKLNGDLLETLEKGKTAVNSLRNTWEGQAADATIESFNRFAANYFQSYHDILNQYVLFLRHNVSEGYFQVEVTGKGLADSFK